MAQAQREFTSVLIKDVTFAWAHLDKPVSPFGTEIYDIRIEVPKKREKELTALNIGKVVALKDKDGNLTGNVGVNLKKKAFKKDGEPAAKVRVVDGSKNPIDPSVLGNGSKGNVIVSQSPYEIKAPNGKVTKSGIQTLLSAVQVTELVRYEPKSGIVDMFDDEGETEGAEPQDADF